jgi:hypothetical protein
MAEANNRPARRWTLGYSGAMLGAKLARIGVRQGAVRRRSKA